MIATEEIMTTFMTPIGIVVTSTSGRNTRELYAATTRVPSKYHKNIGITSFRATGICRRVGSQEFVLYPLLLTGNCRLFPPIVRLAIWMAMQLYTTSAHK